MSFVVVWGGRSDHFDPDQAFVLLTIPSQKRREDGAKATASYEYAPGSVVYTGKNEPAGEAWR